MADSMLDKYREYNLEPSASGQIKAIARYVKQYTRFMPAEAPSYSGSIAPITREKTEKQKELEKEIEEADKNRNW